MPEVVLAPRLCLSAEQIPFPSCCIFLPAKAQEGPEPWQDAGCTGPVGRPLEASPALCSSAGLLGSPSLRGQAAEAQTPQVPAEDSADAEDWRVPGENKRPRALAQMRPAIPVPERGASAEGTACHRSRTPFPQALGGSGSSPASSPPGGLACSCWQAVGASIRQVKAAEAHPRHGICLPKGESLHQP